MSDLTPTERLTKLRALEAWLDWQLRDTRRRIQEVEQQAQAAGQYVSEQERHAGKPVGVTIHTADCSRIGQPVTTIGDGEARTALTKDPSFTHPCVRCRPDLALGIVKE